MKNQNIAAILAALITLAGCGGGGTSTSATPTPVATPAPTVTLTLSAPKVGLGKSSTVTWSSTNATSCTASGAWSGVQAISGSSPQTPTASGANAYTLTCTGAGGSVNQTVTLTVPIPVLKSSYLNKIAAATAIGPQAIPSGYPVAFADFFQDGTYSMVTNSSNYDRNNPATANQFGAIQFWKKVNGAWVDQTSTILTNSTVGCLHPRKAVVADFNGDGVPDVFFACHGFDAPPFPGEKPHMLLSQADGTYKNVIVPVNGYFHSATAADVNGNGYADIVVADPGINKQPFYLVNNKDGTFTPDYTRMPLATAATFNQCNPSCGLAIYSTELIDFDNSGHFDLWFGGMDNGTNTSFASSIFHNPGSNNFSTATRTTLPQATGAGASTTLPLDILFVGGNIYMSRINDSYTAENIQKISYPTLATSMIYTHSGAYSNGSNWFVWMIPYQGNIVSLDSAFSISVPQ